MSNTHKQILVNRQDLSPGLTTKIFTSRPRQPSEAKVEHTFTWTITAGPANHIPAATTDRTIAINVATPSSLAGVVLYEGTPFVFNSKVLYLAEEVTLVGGTSESLSFEVKAGISIVAVQAYTYNLVEYIPLHGVNQYDWKFNGNILEGIIFSGGTVKEKVGSTISPEATMSGDRVRLDPGRDAIRAAVATAKLVDMVLCRPLLDGGFFFTAAPTESGEAGEAEGLLTNDFTLPVTLFTEFKTESGVIDYDTV